MPITIYAQEHVLTGTAADADVEFDVNPMALRFDVYVKTNSLLFSFSGDGTHFSAPREFPAGVLASMDIPVRRFRVKNQTAGSNGVFNVTAYFDPIEVVGRPFVNAP